MDVLQENTLALKNFFDTLATCRHTSSAPKHMIFPQTLSSRSDALIVVVVQFEAVPRFGRC